jgi:hypothetical protein
MRFLQVWRILFSSMVNWSQKLATFFLQGVDMQLGLAVDSPKATLAVKRRLACEMVKYWKQIQESIPDLAASDGWGKSIYCLSSGSMSKQRCVKLHQPSYPNYLIFKSHMCASNSSRLFFRLDIYRQTVLQTLDILLGVAY